MVARNVRGGENGIYIGHGRESRNETWIVIIIEKIIIIEILE